MHETAHRRERHGHNVFIFAARSVPLYEKVARGAARAAILCLQRGRIHTMTGHVHIERTDVRCGGRVQSAVHGRMLRSGRFGPQPGECLQA